MTSKFLTRMPAALALVLALTLSAAGLLAQANSRFVGTIAAIAGDTLTVKTDAGDSKQVKVPSSATLKRIAPGQRDLSTAETIQMGDLATGDRVLVKLDPDATGGTSQALQVVAVKQADVAMKQQKDREEWQRNGTGGLVKSVDAGSGAVVVTSGAGPTAKTVTVHVTKSTVLKRYAPGSVRYDEAKAAPLDEIKPGDQLRARGQKNADGTDLQADEVVSGSFRNISGTVTDMDATAKTFTVKDLISKKPVTIHIGDETQMRRLPDMMARMIAARLKGETASFGGNGAAVAARPPSGPGSPPAGTGAAGGSGQGASAGRQGSWTGGGAGHANGGSDMQQVLNRAPQIQLGDLQKGEAVMLVSTQGTNDVTAITLLAGVEPLLEAPAASQNLLSNWSMGSGGAEAAAQ